MLLKSLDFELCQGLKTDSHPESRTQQQSVERAAFPEVTSNSFPGVHVCDKYREVHLLHLWHNWSAPACSRTGEHWVEERNVMVT